MTSRIRALWARLVQAWSVLLHGIPVPEPAVVEPVVEKAVGKLVPAFTQVPPSEVRPVGRWRVVMYYGERREENGFAGGGDQSRWWAEQTAAWSAGTGVVPDLAEFMDGDARRDWWPRENV